MEPTITPEQEAQLKTWASERDAVLSEIAVLKDQKAIITKYNQDAAQSYTEIITKIQQSIGRMEELDKKEKDWEVIMSNEVAALQTEKTKLEVQVMDLKKEVAIYESKKETLVKDIELLLVMYDQHYGHAQNLDKVIDRVVRISQENMDKLNIFVKGLSPEVQKLFDLVEVNVQKTNLVIDNLPRMMVELQKNGLTKKI